MSGIVNFVLTAAMIAFLTAPIWIPLAAVTRIERDLKAARRRAEDAE
jgi:hypothetical protein